MACGFSPASVPPALNKLDDIVKLSQDVTIDALAKWIGPLMGGMHLPVGL